MRQAMLIHHDYKPIFDMLSDEELGKLFKALLNFDIYGEVTDFEDRTLNGLFVIISGSLVRNAEKYEALCAKRREAALKKQNKKEKEIVSH